MEKLKRNYHDRKLWSHFGMSQWWKVQDLLTRAKGYQCFYNPKDTGPYWQLRAACRENIEQ